MSHVRIRVGMIHKSRRITFSTVMKVTSCIDPKLLIGDIEHQSRYIRRNNEWGKQYLFFPSSAPFHLIVVPRTVFPVHILALFLGGALMGLVPPKKKKRRRNKQLGSRYGMVTSPAVRAVMAAPMALPSPASHLERRGSGFTRGGAS